VRAAFLLIALACCLGAVPARGQTTIEMSKCSDLSFMGPLIAIDYCTRAIKSGQLSNRYLGMAHYNRGLAYAMRGNFDRAIADLTEATRIEAIAPEAATWRSLTFLLRANLYATSQQYDAALADYGEALRLDPTRAEIYVRRGQVWLAKREPDRAIADFTEALRRDIGDRSYYSGVGMTLRDQRRQRDSTEHDAAAYLGRGQGHLLKGDSAGAMADFDAAIRTQPGNPLLFAQRARTREERADLDGAIADYSEALRLRPKDAGLYARRGAAWKAKGENDKALADFEAALAINPKDPATRASREATFGEMERFRR